MSLRVYTPFHISLQQMTVSDGLGFWRLKAQKKIATRWKGLRVQTGGFESIYESTLSESLYQINKKGSVTKTETKLVSKKPNDKIFEAKSYSLFKSGSADWQYILEYFSKINTKIKSQFCKQDIGLDFIWLLDD